MDVALKSPATSFFQLNKTPGTWSFVRSPCPRFAVPSTRFTPMAAISTTQTVGLSETFTRLKKQGKVSKRFTFWFLYYIWISFSFLFRGLLSISIGLLVFFIYLFDIYSSPGWCFGCFDIGQPAHGLVFGIILLKFACHLIRCHFLSRLGNQELMILRSHWGKGGRWSWLLYVLVLLLS